MEIIRIKDPGECKCEECKIRPQAVRVEVANTECHLCLECAWDLEEELDRTTGNTW